MTDRTPNLTAKELAAIDTIKRFGCKMQDATLALRKRSGLRYGVSVGKGRHNIELVAYALNKKGEPFGASTVTTIKGGLLAHEVVAAIESL